MTVSAVGPQCRQFNITFTTHHQIIDTSVGKRFAAFFTQHPVEKLRRSKS
jgi:hypothetical protein